MIIIFNFRWHNIMIKIYQTIPFLSQELNIKEKEYNEEDMNGQQIKKNWMKKILNCRKVYWKIIRTLIKSLKLLREDKILQYRKRK